MSEADEIMIDVFGNIRATTTGIYCDKLNELISSLEQKSDNVTDYMIFYQPKVEEQIKKIAKYFKIEYKSTSLLQNDTLIVLARKEIFKTKIILDKISKEYTFYNMSFGWIGGEDE